MSSRRRRFEESPASGRMPPKSAFSKPREPIIDGVLSQYNLPRYTAMKKALQSLLLTAGASIQSQQEHTANMDSFMAELSKGKGGSIRVMQELGKLWAKTYDIHMVDHEEAIRKLLGQLAALDRMGFGNYDKPLIGRRIFEMSCGTGMVIKALCDEMPEVTTSRHKITANDISPKMKAVARQKLKGVCDVDFTEQDIRSMDFGNRHFDTIIWSQTLHLVMDPELFAKEMDPEHPAEKSDHRQMKMHTIQRAFDLLPWGGYFVFFEEWPAKFTPTYTSALEALVNQLFSCTFRPIADLSILRDDIMRNVDGARLVAECKERIDREHSMYMLVYVKDKDDANKRPALPRSEADARKGNWEWSELTGLRSKVREQIIQGFKAVDGPFLSHQLNRAVHGFIPFNEGVVFDATGYDASRIECTLSKRSGCDTIILPEILHKLDAERRKAVIRSAVRALKPGGSIALLEEWPFDKTNDPHGIHKTEVRRMMRDMDEQLTLEATLRERIRRGYDSGIYGFLYRVK